MNPGIWTKFEGNPILGGERLGTCFDVNGVRVRREPVLVPESDCEKLSVMNPYVRWDAARGIWRMWYAAGETY